MADVAASEPLAGTPSPGRRRARPAARSTADRRLRISLYLAASAVWVLAIGLPVERIAILGWLFGLLAVSVAGEGAARMRGLVCDWGLFALLLLVYRYSAGLADGVGRPVLKDGLVDVDRIIGLGEVPTVRLQEWFPQDAPVPWWQVPLSFVYVSHFFGVLVAAAWLWSRERAAWVRYTKRLLTLGACAVVTYVLFPAAPPWMAAEQGLTDPIERSAFLGWERVGLGLLAPVVEQGRAVANPVAALPSMHAGFAMFLAAFLWSRTTRLGRVALAVYALAMAFTLVLTGEHWVADVLLGWVYVAAVMSVWNVVERRRAGRTDAASTRPDEWPAGGLPDPSAEVGTLR